MNEAEWRKLPVGAWFFTDDPSCIQRYSVMERTSGGCVNVCSSCWHHDGAKKDMKSIADDHYAAAQLAEKEREIARLTTMWAQSRAQIEKSEQRLQEAQAFVCASLGIDHDEEAGYTIIAEPEPIEAGDTFEEAIGEFVKFNNKCDDDLIERLRQREAELEQLREHCVSEHECTFAALPAPPKEGATS